MLRPLFHLALPAALFLSLASNAASAQSVGYDARWFTGLRENVLALQERHRERVAALRELRQREAVTVSEPVASTPPASFHGVSAQQPLAQRHGRP